MFRKGTLRLFVAIFPPAQVAEALVRTLDAFTVPRASEGWPPLPTHRAVDASKVHLTLVFIGESPAKELRTIGESVERSCAGLGGFVLTPTALVTIPPDVPRSPPALIAATTDAPPALLEIQRRLAIRLARPRKPGRVEHFLPHLTLCRFPVGTRGGPWQRTLSGTEQAETTFSVSRVDLVASVLTQAGAVYEVVGGARLG